MGDLAVRSLVLAATLLALSACATTPPAITGGPAVDVAASGETVPVGTSNADAADDPAIWRNPRDPAASLIVGTDKRAGLYLYGLDGAVRDFSPDGRLNNVDLVTLADGRVIVAASDRNDPARAAIRLYWLDTAYQKLRPLGTVPGGVGEAYGICLHREGETLHAASVLKEGLIEQFRLDVPQRGVPTSTPVLIRRVPTQPEGCVFDPRDGTLYVGEEDAGIWRFAAGSAEGTLVLPVDNRMLVADVEGLALIADGERGGYLVASSQGDNAYAVFRLPDLAPVGRFRIAGGTIGGAEETDGIALAAGDFGPAYPGGLFVAQDGRNAPQAQNFKLVSWAAIRAAIGGE